MARVKRALVTSKHVRHASLSNIAIEIVKLHIVPAELHDEALFKEHPPTDDCPICFLPIPLNATESNFYPCCGKIICDGCVYAMMKEALDRGKKLISENTGNLTGEIGICAFCRTPPATSDANDVEQIKKLMENGNAEAFNHLAGYYRRGIMGMPQDMTMAIELWLRAGELGHAEAYFNLGNSYNDGEGVEVDKKKAKYFYELAAMNGSLEGRHNLGCMEGRAGNFHRAYKHFMLAARAGYKNSLDQVKTGFMKGVVLKDEYANVLRAYQERHDEMKSDMRDKAEELENNTAT